MSKRFFIISIHLKSSSRLLSHGNLGILSLLLLLHSFLLGLLISGLVGPVHVLLLLLLVPPEPVLPASLLIPGSLGFLLPTFLLSQRMVAVVSPSAGALRLQFVNVRPR